MKKVIKQVGLVFFDLVAIWISILVAFSLRFEWAVPPEYKEQFHMLLWLLPLIRFPFLIGYKLHREIWKYASIREMERILMAVGEGSLLLYLLNSLHILVNIPRSVVILEGLICTGAIGVLRLVPRFYPSFRGMQASGAVKNIVIIGAGDAGAMLLKDAMKHPEIKVVGFIDDDVTKQGMNIHGVKVLGGREKLPKVIEDFTVDEIVIAMPSADRREVREIVEIARSTRKPIKILPGLYELVGGNLTVSQLREVRLEDLLGRKPVYVDLQEAGKYLKGKVVLVTGAGGSIGSELCRQVARCDPAELILLGHGENSIYEIHKELVKKFPSLVVKQVIADIRNTEKIDRIIAKYRPDVIYHAAAHKHVPLMEENVDEAITNNILGTRNLAEAADRYGVSKFILISTDKAVNPSSVMGATKRVAEVIIQEMALESKTTFLAVRFGNVLGSRGSVVPLFREQIMEDKVVTITDPQMTRYFMTIPEASQLVIKAGAIGKGGEIFILDMGEPVKILDLATTLIRLMGFEPYKDVKIEFTGIRPGEKLYEELRFDAETMEKTADEKIWVLRNGSFHGKWKAFDLRVDELIAAAAEADGDNLRDSLMALARSLDRGGEGLTSHEEVAVTAPPPQ